MYIKKEANSLLWEKSVKRGEIRESYTRGHQDMMDDYTWSCKKMENRVLRTVLEKNKGYSTIWPVKVNRNNLKPCWWLTPFSLSLSLSIDLLPKKNSSQFFFQYLQAIVCYWCGSMRHIKLTKKEEKKEKNIQYIFTTVKLKAKKRLSTTV